jgi:hypothetical protein
MDMPMAKRARVHGDGDGDGDGDGVGMDMAASGPESMAATGPETTGFVPCRFCHAKVLLAYTELDHVRAKRFGGSDAKWNLQRLCAACHKKKTTGEARFCAPMKSALADAFVHVMDTLRGAEIWAAHKREPPSFDQLLKLMIPIADVGAMDALIHAPPPPLAAANTAAVNEAMDEDAAYDEAQAQATLGLAVTLRLKGALDRAKKRVARRQGLETETAQRKQARKAAKRAYLDMAAPADAARPCIDIRIMPEKGKQGEDQGEGEDEDQGKDQGEDDDEAQLAAFVQRHVRRDTKRTATKADITQAALKFFDGDTHFRWSVVRRGLEGHGHVYVKTACLFERCHVALDGFDDEGALLASTDVPTLVTFVHWFVQEFAAKMSDAPETKTRISCVEVYATYVHVLEALGYEPQFGAASSLMRRLKRDYPLFVDNYTHVHGISHFACKDIKVLNLVAAQLDRRFTFDTEVDLGAGGLTVKQDISRHTVLAWSDNKANVPALATFAHWFVQEFAVKMTDAPKTKTRISCAAMYKAYVYVMTELGHEPLFTVTSSLVRRLKRDYPLFADSSTHYYNGSYFECEDAATLISFIAELEQRWAFNTTFDLGTWALKVYRITSKRSGMAHADDGNDTNIVPALTTFVRAFVHEFALKMAAVPHKKARMTTLDVFGAYKKMMEWLGRPVRFTSPEVLMRRLKRDYSFFRDHAQHGDYVECATATSATDFAKKLDLRYTFDDNLFDDQCCAGMSLIVDGQSPAAYTVLR